jgi:glycosyltransferase involved in cell wall biosynthesis
VIYQAAADHEGRPVADLLAAASHAPDIDVTIRLVDVDRERLGSEIRALGIDDRVQLSDPVEPNRLVEGMAGFDVGVILNRDGTPNDALAVPGKLWEYMMAGLGTVAPRLPGLALVEELGVGLGFSPGRPEELGRQLQALAEDRTMLATLRERARELAFARFNSVTQAKELHRVWGL